MAQYRNPYSNFYSDKSGSYMSIGSIVPVLVDSYSTSLAGANTGEGSGGDDPNFSYRNFMYCDGAQYDIKDYPLLYEKIGNDYVTLNSEKITNNAIRSNVSGDPGTVYRTFVDGTNVFVEIYAKPIAGTNSYERVVPNNATISFDELGDYPTAGGQVVENTAYRLEYSDTYQANAAITGTHVYRMLLNYDPSNTGGGGGSSPGGAVTWTLTSTSLLPSVDGALLPIANYGTIPALDPGTFDPLTGTGYPTGYTQYTGADNDTIAISWSNLSGLPASFAIDTYELVLEDLAIVDGNGNAFRHWHLQNIPSTITGLTVNQSLINAITILQNSVEQTSLGSAPDWVNNGYSGPQPPSGERHTYRLHIKAILTDAQELVTHVDFQAGSGSLIPDYNRAPYFTDNLIVVGGDDGFDPNAGSLDVIINTLATQPTIRIRKTFNIQDLPYILGKFRVPDYRDRKLLGFGEGVDGAGTPLPGNAAGIKVGDTGGQWYISTDVIEDPAEFYQISDVLTSGYTNVETLISPYLIGEKEYVVGPIQDYIFSRPPTHNHQLLHSEPDETTQGTATSGADIFTTSYLKYRGFIDNFIPNATAETRGHSHGLLGYRPLSPKTSTIGNVDGIGERVQTNNVNDKSYDVNDVALTWTLNGTALINWGTGFGEAGGFTTAGSGQQYLAFGTPGTTTFTTHQATREASVSLNCEGYGQFFVLAKGGNDTNGGERVNDTTDNLRIRFSSPNVESGTPTPWVELMESAGTFNIANGTTGYAAYDASYAVWKNRYIDIPVNYQGAAAQPVTFEMQQTSDSKVTGSNPVGEYDSTSGENLTGTLNDPAGSIFQPNAYDAFGVAKIGLTSNAGDGAWDGCYNYKVTEPGAIPFTSASANGSVLTVIFPGVHEFSIGQNVAISGAANQLNGNYEIIADGFSASVFKALTTKVGSSSIGTASIATGYFQEFPVTPTPRVWIVDNTTVIGGKEIIVVQPGEGEERYNETYDSGTHNIAASASGDNVLSYVVQMQGGGGGGGGSTGNGDSGNPTELTLNVDGQPYVIIASGGGGGTSGNNGGGGGQGGTYSIPAALFADPRFSFDTSVSGDNGLNGGVDNGAQPAGGNSPPFGSKGYGGNGGFSQFVSSDSWTNTWTADGEIPLIQTRDWFPVGVNDISAGAAAVWCPWLLQNGIYKIVPTGGSDPYVDQWIEAGVGFEVVGSTLTQGVQVTFASDGLSEMTWRAPDGSTLGSASNSSGNPGDGSCWTPNEIFTVTNLAVGWHQITFRVRNVAAANGDNSWANNPCSIGFRGVRLDTGQDIFTSRNNCTGGTTTFTVPGSGGNTGSYNVNNTPGFNSSEGSQITSVNFDISGGSGGNGPPNGIFNCVGYIGGTASAGRRVTGVIPANPGTLSWEIGLQGAEGLNQQEGSIDEPSVPGGIGTSNGGPSGAGAWGNGGSGGGGGGSTSLSGPAGIIYAGAGGGGGGGGTGGGDNNGSAPGGVQDLCWIGGAGLPPLQGLANVNPIGFTGGGSGGSKGCTAGGGGGGGGGAGPSGGGNGGDGGEAGANHSNTGSGNGGWAGRSAVNSSVVTSASESAGSTGDGYVSLTVNFQAQGNNPSGGGGGAGAGLAFSIQREDPQDNIQTAFAVSVGSAGNGGAGGGSNGEGGRVTLACYGQLPGDDNVVGISEPAGRFWDVPDFPNAGYLISGNPQSGTLGAIWHSASPSVEVVGSTGSNFPLANNISNNLSNRNIRFEGAGNRFLQIGPFNLTNVDQLTMGIIKGNNSNGGESPEEDLVIYWKPSLEATSETALQAIAQSGSISASGWVNYSVPLDANSDARANGIYLIIRQTRPDNSGDNPDDDNDNWGIALFGVRYATYTDRVFVPTLDATLPGNEGSCGPEDGINVIKRVVDAASSNIRFTDGTMNLSASTPVSVTGTAQVQETLPLVTKYHRSKYLIKAL